MSTIAKTDDEKIFSAGLIAPLLFTGAYIAFLKYLHDQLYEEALVIGKTAAFKGVWISGPIFFSVLYLIAIFLGQSLMKNREAFQIKPYIFTYNLYQCIFNIWTVFEMIREVRSNPWFVGYWGATSQDGMSGFRISFLVWIHYNNKFLELLDTMWMILRKKNNQITFLHCYHHLLLIWAWWYCVSIESGGDVYFGACVNSFIHIIMYGYYTMALLGIPCPWKKWITKCQLLQFALVLCHSLHAVYYKNQPIQLPLAQGFVMINMLVLFSNFYMNSYAKKPAAKKVE